ncbi:hypothetical protein ACYUJ6_14475 [Clostridium sp. JNZ X4-2]
MFKSLLTKKAECSIKVKKKKCSVYLEHMSYYNFNFILGFEVILKDIYDSAGFYYVYNKVYIEEEKKQLNAYLQM